MRNALFKRVFGAAALVLGLSLAGAQVAFADQFSTDADVLDTGINASDAGNAATSGGSAVTITGAIAIVQQGNGNNRTTFPVDVPLRITSTDGSAAWATITPSSVHLTAYNVYQDFAVSVAVPAGTPSATYSFQVQGNPPQPQIGIGPGATYGFSVINPLKPPVLSLSGNIAGVEATSSNGAPVSFAATAADANGADPVTCTPGSGSTFALGTITVNCSSTNAAGRSSGSFTVTVVDTTTPTISAPVISGQQGSNGWFTGPVTVTFGCSDYFLASCSPSSPVVLGSDGANQGFTITAKDSSGNTATQTVGGINIDQTVPSNIAGTPDRGTDSNGWYNHGLNVGFKATFGPSSGSCTAGSYSGPDTGSASVATTCTSGAGLSAQGSFGPFQYDGTAPSNVAGAAARGADSNGWYNAPVGIGFTGTFSASGGNCTSTTYSAPNSAAATQAGSCDPSRQLHLRRWADHQRQLRAVRVRQRGANGGHRGRQAGRQQRLVQPRRKLQLQRHHQPTGLGIQLRRGGELQRT